ncbi:TetR/AcrR family transcriptional regulator [Phaeobacter sp. B1627]|uniref:TetR/AcrR family transcriptional regulator n=1 Tax=Phaeobacter sp. B1627 TaxID=2583809 RepID=UPI0011180437|nr:TetR/AcrR family transcriptional regulator [Phaeobacter sp. B1627]TNJ47455.1 TetR/AcrR family transcriptional regulator [Phaeobacter sp. B1627]
MLQSPNTRTRGSRQLWLDAALNLLATSGIDAVKIMPLAKSVGQTRTGFYWYFKDLSALHDAMIETWETRNTGQIQARCEAPAGTINQALFNLMDCWLSPELFDTRLDLAIRNWARNDPRLAARLHDADAARITAVRDMFLRYGYSPEQADVRSLTVIYTQIGYISLQVEENPAARLARVPHYVEMFSSRPPAPEEIAAFRGRHPVRPG